MVSVLLLATTAYAANMELEILNIREPGTSTAHGPPLPSTYRILYAYPGIEYKIRAAVVGGDYPYSYSLVDAPEGMEVDQEGYIRWENPQQDASNITLAVIDSNGTEVNSTWSIRVQAEGFMFVDTAAMTDGNGSIGSPFNSITSMTTGSSPDDIIYFREGTYELPARGEHTINNASAFEWSNPSDISTRWLAYPGEEAIVDLGGDKYLYGSTSIPFYFDGITLRNGREYFFRTNSAQEYVTFLDNTFENLTLERTHYNSNQGTYFTMYGGRGYNQIWQGNTFRGFRGTQGIGSFYDQDTILVEDNYLTDFEGSDLGSTNQVFAFKVGIVRLTLRGNVVNQSQDDDFGIFGGSSINCGFVDGEGLHGPQSEQIEILYNYFRHEGTARCQLNRGDDMGVTWVHRNTFVAPFQMTHLSDSDCDGPWTIEDNVFQNPDAGITYHYTCEGDYESCVPLSGNIAGTEGIVDEGGLLLEGYSSSLGEAGWQFDDGSTPRDLASDSFHEADTNEDGLIEKIEIDAYIDSWLRGSVPIADIIQAIGLWKAG